jgi:hypothetical protein
MRVSAALSDAFVLGTARVVIQDHTDLPLEQRPPVRITECPVVAVGDLARRIVRKFLRWAMRKFGYLGLIALAAHLGARSVDFDITTHLPMVIGAITSAVATSWKAEIGTATHNFTTGQNVVKTALYTSSATLGASTTAYSATNEISGTGYTAAGVTMANVTPTTSGTTAIFDWADAQWTSASFTANGSLSYNSSASNKAIFVIAFGSDQTVTSGTFTIQWPTADASNAIIRIA